MTSTLQASSIYCTIIPCYELPLEWVVACSPFNLSFGVELNPKHKVGSHPHVFSTGTFPSTQVFASCQVIFDVTVSIVVMTST